MTRAKLLAVLAWLADNAANLATIAALAAVGAGCWLLHSAGLGLLVVGGVVFVSLAFTRIRGY